VIYGGFNPTEEMCALYTNSSRFMYYINLICVWLFSIHLHLRRWLIFSINMKIESISIKIISHRRHVFVMEHGRTTGESVSACDQGLGRCRTFSRGGVCCRLWWCFQGRAWRQCCYSIHVKEKMYLLAHTTKHCIVLHPFVPDTLSLLTHARIIKWFIPALNIASLSIDCKIIYSMIILLCMYVFCILDVDGFRT